MNKEEVHKLQTRIRKALEDVDFKTGALRIVESKQNNWFSIELELREKVETMSDAINVTEKKKVMNANQIERAVVVLTTFMSMELEDDVMNARRIATAECKAILAELEVEKHEPIFLVSSDGFSGKVPNCSYVKVKTPPESAMAVPTDEEVNEMAKALSGAYNKTIQGAMQCYPGAAREALRLQGVEIRKAEKRCEEISECDGRDYSEMKKERDEAKAQNKAFAEQVETLRQMVAEARGERDRAREKSTEKKYDKLRSRALEALDVLPNGKRFGLNNIHLCAEGVAERLRIAEKDRDDALGFKLGDCREHGDSERKARLLQSEHDKAVERADDLQELFDVEDRRVEEVEGERDRYIERNRKLESRLTGIRRLSDGDIDGH